MMNPKIREKLLLEYSRRSLAFYLENVVIKCPPTPQQFGAVAEPWQRQLFAPKIPLFEGLADLRDYTGPWSFCDILARGHDKSSLEGRLATWLLLAARRKISGYILAADEDQGKLVLDALRDEAALNPWVDSQITIRKNRVESDRGFFEVLPADAAGAWGLRGNCYILDEWCNWNRRGQEMWGAVISGREKIQPAILGIVTNAGFLGSWQHRIYETFRTNRDFVVWDKPGQLASWMPKERVDALRQMVPPAEARRVFDNEWIDLAEENDYLTRAEVMACEDPTLIPRLAPHYSVRDYVMVVDYAAKRDRAVVLIGHKETDRVIVDLMEIREKASVAEVEELIEKWHAIFRTRRIIIDPHQMLGTIQRFTRARLPVEEIKFRAGRHNQELAQALREAVVARRVAWYPKCGDLPTDTLVDELARLVTVRKNYGFRFDHTSEGHDDRAFCLASLIFFLNSTNNFR